MAQSWPWGSQITDKRILYSLNTNTLEEGLIDMKQYQKLGTMKRRVINRGKRNKAIVGVPPSDKCYTMN